ncbi:hypothetical protein [Trichloromonas sp.]|uniref:hypothetical protein n=1 Tax=Trichloromonas sp. TaxID=3069249 RepID=UPI002A458CD3|nr:hypothetical protein [Trichloromonas sp.]
MIKNFNEYVLEGNDSLKDERKQILDFIGHNNWNIVMRKLNNIRFSDFRYKFENALRNIKLSIDFIDKYKDLKLFPSFIDNVLDNPNYNEEELINIIKKFPDYINWYNVFYNKNIPLWFKKENYDKIYNDSLNSYDISVPMNIRIKNTKKALSVLKNNE